jgi:hypothetical protein
MSDDRMTDGEKFFLAVVAFLLLKGLIDAADTRDRKTVKNVWQRFKAGKQGATTPTLWGPAVVDPFADLD